MSLSVFAAAAEAPDGDAVIAGGRVHSWSELAEQVQATVGTLRTARLAAGDTQPVAMVAGTDLPSVVTLHALIAMGATVHLLHPRLSAAERDAIVERVRPRLVLDPAVGSSSVIEPARTTQGTPGFSPGIDSAPATQGAPRAHAPAVPPADEGILAVVYTSGSSGSPKGVVLSRRAFAASAAASAARLGWRKDDRWLLRIPLAHVGGLSIITRCLLARRCVVLADEAAAGSDGTALLTGQLERDRVTLLSVVPTLLARLLDGAEAVAPPPHLRVVLLGGAAAPADLVERAAALGWPVVPTYGLTEACSQVATQWPGRVDPDAGAGPPLDGVDLRIVADEIQLRSAALFSGYHSRFPGAAHLLEGGWFATGDIGRIDAAGNLHVLGRRDHLIVSGGENVDPLEVETALRASDWVKDVCVFGLSDEQWGQRVCAAIVPSPGREPDLGALDRELRVRLAGFKRPRAYALMQELPMLPSGKLDRRRIARIACVRAVPQEDDPR